MGTDFQAAPELRFPQFTREWNRTCLGNVLQFFPTNSLSRKEIALSGSGPQIIHYGDIHVNYSSTLDLKRASIPSALESVVRGVSCELGDLLIADASEDYLDIGKATEVVELGSKPTFGGLHVIHARPQPNVFALGFLAYLFKCRACRLELMRRANGATVLGLSSKQIGQINLRIPGPPEQQKIAEFMSAVDERIAKLKRKKELLEEYKRGMMQKLFSQEIRFKDEDGNDFPDWTYGALSEFLNERNDQAPESEDYPLMAFMAGRGVAPKGERYNREFLVKSDSKKYKRTEKGDFIYSSNNLETGSIGLNRFGSASISPVYSIFSVRENCLSEYIGRALRQPAFIYQMIRFRQGVVYGQWRIHERNFLQIKWRFPSLPEQMKIGGALNQIDTKIASLSSQIEKGQEFKRGLLQKMFV